MIGNYFLLVEVKNPGLENEYLNIKAKDLYDAIRGKTLALLFYAGDEPGENREGLGFDIIIGAGYNKNNFTYDFSTSNMQTFTASGNNSYPVKA